MVCGWAHFTLGGEANLLDAAHLHTPMSIMDTPGWVCEPD